MHFQMSMAKRLGLGFVVIIGLFCLLSGTATLWVRASTMTILDRMYSDVAKGNQYLAEAQNALWSLRFGVAQYIANPAQRKRWVEEGPKWFAAFDESLVRYSGTSLGAEQKLALDGLKAIYEEYKSDRPKWFELMEAGKEQEAAEFRARTILKSGHGTVDAFGRLIEIHTKSGAAIREAADAAFRQVIIVSILAGLFVVAAAGAIAAFLTRSVTRPLGGEPDQAKTVVGRIAQGDLTAEISVKPGDADSLIAVTRHMRDSLRRMVGGLKANAEGVAAAARQLASASGQVATASAHQSEAASAMAAAMEEMTVSINHVSGSAAEARNITARTGDLSREGNRVIQDTVAEMKQISGTVGEAATAIQAMGEESQKMSAIVLVIKEVADQTNLLALNASIEAARAGEQGRGFAVVADEVKRLAERTTQATGEISGMIGSMQASAQTAVGTMQEAVSRVGQGVNMAQQAGDSMVGISDGAQRVVCAVNEISEALKEQSVAANDIAANVEKIAQMSEENSVATRKTAETAQELERLASYTREAVEWFTV